MLMLVSVLTFAFLIKCVTLQGESCVTMTTDQVSGICTKLSDCSEFYELNRTTIEVLVNRHKICNSRLVNRDPIVCCTSRGLPRTQTASNSCGISRQMRSKPVDQSIVTVNSWPWLALLMYTDFNGNRLFKCGGSLITNRHVLSAAHCIQYDLTTVRLGEHDLDTDTETKHIDVPVINTIVHPNYDERDGTSDVAVLVLGHVITFTPQITPICFPTSASEKSINFEGYHPFVAGWGFTPRATQNARQVLQEFQLPILPNQKCSDQFNENFSNDIICAAAVSATGLNGCQVDSGGPLMIPNLGSDRNFFYEQIGIISGSYGCGRTDALMLFTKVSTFIDWIQEQVAKPI